MTVEARKTLWACAVALTAGTYALLAQPVQHERKTADLHTAIALTQAHLYGTGGLTANADGDSPVADVLLIVASSNWDAVRSRIALAGMAIRFDDRRSGYLRVTVPLEEVRQLFEWSDVDAVRVDGLAGYDTRLQQQALSQFGFSPSGEWPAAGVSTDPTPLPHPPLTLDVARHYPVNPDQDMGITEFRAANPTFDGRGVTIGIIESTWIPIDHPAFAPPALAVDGAPHRKVLRYLDYPSVRREGVSAPWSAWFECQSAVCEAHGRVLRLPGAGRFRMADLTVFGVDLGSGRRGTGRYTVLQQASSERLYVDANGDLDFFKERPLVDFNVSGWTPQSIVTLAYPGGAPVKAVVSVESGGQFVWLHPFTGDHVTMTASVAAGSDDETSWAAGVAPKASLVFADGGPRNRLLSHALEGVITLARDKEVDLVSASLPIETPLGTRESFDAVAIDRISEAYDKPILISAGNYMVPLSNSPAPGGRVAMTVGQYVSSRTTEALYGVKRTDVPEFGSTVGPAFDGSTKPDFIASSKRVAATPCDPPPSHTFQTRYAFPPCYVISGGTSAAAPSAAGAVALLISAAKQRHIKPSVHQIRAALLASAALVRGIPAHIQGFGLINVGRAWQQLQHPMSVSSLDIEGEIRHAFVDVLGPVQPKGLVLVTRSDERQLMTLTLHSAVRRGRDRLFVRSEGALKLSAPDSIALNPEGRTRLQVAVRPPEMGRVASAWVTFAAAPHGEIVDRMLATAARPAVLAAPAHQYAWEEDVEFSSHRDTLIAVPMGTTGMLVEVDYAQGDGVPTVSTPWSLPLLSRAFWSGGSFFVTPARLVRGHYAGVLLDPARGDWGVASHERSATHSAVWAASTELPKRYRASYRATVFRTECELNAYSIRAADAHVRVSVRDAYAQPVDGGVIAAPATIESTRFTLHDEFERPSATIDVKPGTAVFHVEARQQGGDGVVLQLFDCTAGHCLAQIQSTPGERTPTLNVREPQAGLWKVFAVPVRPLYQPTPVTITVTQSLSDDFKPLAPVVATGTSSDRLNFEGTIPRRDGSSDLMLLRTDARTARNPEGWGAISLCLPATQTTELRSNRVGAPRNFLLEQKR